MSVETVPMPVAAGHQSEVSLRAKIGRVLCVVVPVIIWFAPLDIAPTAKHGIAITSFMLVAWITEAMEHALAGLTGCFLFWSLGVVPVGVAFGGFGTDTPWFVFGALLFGAMVTKSGLGRRLAFAVMERAGKTYAQILLGVTITGFLLTFIVPSGLARVVVMAPIALGLMEAFGVGPGTNIGRATFLIITYGAGLFDKMIIAGAAAITARGFIEEVGGVQVLWAKWFFAFLPCTVLTIFVMWRLALWLFPPEKAGLDRESRYLRDEIRKMGTWTPLEKKTALFMFAGITLWLTDFVHHISPAEIGFGIGLLAVMPGIGVITFDDMKRSGYMNIFFVAAAVSMGTVLIQTKGLDLLTNFMLAWMEPLLTSTFISTIVLYVSAFVYHFFLASEVSMHATSMPLLMNFAKTQGLNPLAIGMIWTFAAGGKIFLYQSGVLMLGYSYGYFQAKDLFKFGLWLSIIEAGILLLLVSFYWPIIGI